MPGRAVHRDWQRAARSLSSITSQSACAATTALVVCVLSDAVLAALRLVGTGLSAQALVPVLSMAIEIACVGFLISRLRAVTLRAASTAALVKA